jgi:hypothetical protein
MTVSEDIINLPEGIFAGTAVAPSYEEHSVMHDPFYHSLKPAAAVRVTLPLPGTVEDSVIFALQQGAFTSYNHPVPAVQQADKLPGDILEVMGFSGYLLQ